MSDDEGEVLVSGQVVQPPPVAAAADGPPPAAEPAEGPAEPAAAEAGAGAEAAGAEADEGGAAEAMDVDPPAGGDGAAGGADGADKDPQQFQHHFLTDPYGWDGTLGKPPRKEQARDQVMADADQPTVGVKRPRDEDEEPAAGGAGGDRADASGSGGSPAADAAAPVGGDAADAAPSADAADRNADDDKMDVSMPAASAADDSGPARTPMGKSRRAAAASAVEKLRAGERDAAIEPTSRPAKEKADKPVEKAAKVHQYHPAKPLPTNLAKCVDTDVRVRVLGKFLTTTSEPFRRRLLWGAGVYTQDSDLVAALVHSGFITLTASPPPFVGVLATVRILGPQQEYPSCLINNVRSRHWGHYNGLSFQIQDCVPLSDRKGTVERTISLKYPGGTDARKRVNVAPAKAGADVGLDADPQFVPDITFRFNHSNEPCLKYSVSIMADRGVEKDDWTSHKLKNNVLFVETEDARFELSQAATRTGPFVSYRWAVVQSPRQLSAATIKTLSLPLESKYLTKIVESNLDWEDIVWGPDSLSIRGVKYLPSAIFWQSTEEDRRKVI